MVDREAVTPLLLRVFCSTLRPNSINDYARGGSFAPHQWMRMRARMLTRALLLDPVSDQDTRLLETESGTYGQKKLVLGLIGVGAVPVPVQKRGSVFKQLLYVDKDTTFLRI
jgi:hypothetical protein